MSDNTAKPTPSPQLRDALFARLETAILPGEEPLNEDRLREIASFLAASAINRTQGKHELAIESLTGERRRLRIAIINDDMPFLVDSVAATLAGQGLTINQLLHPIVPVERAGDGTLKAIDPEAQACESMIYIETPRVDARQRRELLDALQVTLGDVRAAVDDWPAMQAQMAKDAQSAQPGSEEAALLEWLNRGMLTQLGHTIRTKSGETQGALGICSTSTPAILADASYSRAFEWFEQKSEDDRERQLLIVKANHVSNVHRRVPLDLFIVPRRENGVLTALSVHAGIWTSAALATSPSDVPIMRASLAALTSEFEFSPNGHAGKALVHAFTSLPHNLLVAFDHQDVRYLTTAMMSLVDRPRPRLVLVRSALERHVFAFVWLPRDALSTAVRLQIQDLLTQAPGSAVLDWSLEVEGSALALLQFMIDTRECEAMPDATTIEHQIEDLVRGWGEAVEEALGEMEAGGRSAAIAGRYASAFPQSYRGAFSPADAARDIARLRKLAARYGRTSGARDVRLYHSSADQEQHLRLKIAHISGELTLSDAVPTLENFGFGVLTQMATDLADGSLGTIHDFTLSLPPGASAQTLIERSPQIEAAIAEVLNGGAENDPFNRLVIATALGAREAEWLRAIYRYLRQTGMGFTIYTVVDALQRAPDATRAMIALFEARHDPDFTGDREAAIAKARADFTAALALVSAINDDRLLRLYRGVIDATLRTNAFAPAASEALAFKIDSALMPGLPKPVPWREIFVYSRRVEGIHLRSGAVARGGLRWSDRRDDFRTEILGLMKAQRVKNAVIVPSGAKGGFYPKLLPNPAQDREAWASEGQASYEVFIRTLLSVTDNIVDGAVVHPEAVRILDGEDPYFVVAADKGTARFSDVANAIADERDFWLDDAFASGGSNGYDHKAMGITAKGAWVSVQRHFLEMGTDVQTDSVRVVGCGDMSGDVFGNGMLLSKAIKLVAAFDHRHIFLDPDPDPATSWQERERLFSLPRSSWEDYDTALLSKGGGVFSRASKTITISDEARDALGLEGNTTDPDTLIAAILKAPVDLIWFGGIGTYIKAASENHIEVGDPGNDPLRVNAEEVRARAIGEGANLGVTQAARIAFALRGGRINTDFIDNSGGVDCSDNEVNIKIALAAAVRAGDLTQPDRNALLEEMTDAVSDIVLEDNRLQALALSIAEARSAASMESYARVIERLEEAGELDRKTEGLADSETLARRAAEGQGLTRPELAVLLSTAKLAMQDAIEASALPDDPAQEETLLAMFPAAMRDRFAKPIREHRLRRELIATEIANRIINRLGILSVFDIAEEEGTSLAAVASAFVAAERLFGLRSLWADIDAADLPEATRIALFDRTSQAIRGHLADLVRARNVHQSASDLAAELAENVAVLADNVDALLVGESRDSTRAMEEEMIAAGASAELALRISRLFAMDGAVGLARLGRKADVEIIALTDAFASLGVALGLDWAQGTAALMAPSDVWEKLLVAGLARDFQQMRLDFLRRQLRRQGEAKDARRAVSDWLEANPVSIGQFKTMIERAQAHAQTSPAILAQIASQARNLLDL